MVEQRLFMKLYSLIVSRWITWTVRVGLHEMWACWLLKLSITGRVAIERVGWAAVAVILGRVIVWILVA